MHWDHRGEARNVIGSADPTRMREVAGLGLYVEGKLDLDDSEVAREAWRSMKDTRAALSFGYMTVKSQSRDGINELLELDLYEISIAPHPANPHTRILEMKTMAVEQRSLRRRSAELELEAALGWEPIPAFVEPEAKSGPTDAELREQAKALGLPVPLPRKGTRERFRDDMFDLLMGR